MPHHHATGRLAGGAALGFIAGLSLPHLRKALMQGPSVAAGDWIEALKAEHRLVEAAFEKLLATSDDQVMQRDMLLAKIAYALNKHGIEEENVIYPALARTRPDDAKHLTEDHGDIKRFIFELRRMPTTDATWLGKAEEFRDTVASHVREEEDEIFPAFHAALSADENAEFTRMLNWEGFKVA